MSFTFTFDNCIPFLWFVPHIFTRNDFHCIYTNTLRRRAKKEREIRKADKFYYWENIEDICWKRELLQATSKHSSRKAMKLFVSMQKLSTLHLNAWFSICLAFTLHIVQCTWISSKCTEMFSAMPTYWVIEAKNFLIETHLFSHNVSDLKRKKFKIFWVSIYHIALDIVPNWLSRNKYENCHSALFDHFCEIKKKYVTFWRFMPIAQCSLFMLTNGVFWLIKSEHSKWNATLKMFSKMVCVVQIQRVIVPRNVFKFSAHIHQQ